MINVPSRAFCTRSDVIRCGLSAKSPYSRICFYHCEIQVILNHKGMKMYRKPDKTRYF